MKFERINEEIINDKLYFYHSARNLDTAKYIINSDWRTSSGLYGDGVYGQQYPDPTSPQNRLSSGNIDRYKGIYGGTYRFKIKYDDPKNIFYLDLDAGKEMYGPDYDENMALDILKKHKVPLKLRNHIKRFFSSGHNTPALSDSDFSIYGSLGHSNIKNGGLLGGYGFTGLAYHGNQDGKCILHWFPNTGVLHVEAYSTDFGKTWVEYDPNNTAQVSALNKEIQDKINQLSGHVNSRKQQISNSGKIPALSTQGKDRDWIRIIECGNKAGYNFVDGDFTSGSISSFANLVQKQLNASKDPKKSNRYDIAIKLLPEVQSRISKY